MEHDMSLVLLSEFYKFYNIKENNTSMNLLYHYIYIKTGIKNNNKKVDEKQLINFIYEELNITIFKDKSPYLIYKDIEYNAEQVAKDFIEYLEFRANFEGNINIKEVQEKIYLDGYKKSSKYMKSKYYKTHIKYNRLIELNNYFKINVEANPILEFGTNEDYNPFERTLEERWKSIIDSDKVRSNTTQYISEEDLEDYVSKNLNLIEDGLVFLKRQVIVDGGRIDILAKDKNSKLTIIELKIDDDKSLIWQAMHYPEQISKIYRINKADIRMLTVSPSYKKSVLDTLNNIENVEMYNYTIEVSFGIIKKLKVYKDN